MKVSELAAQTGASIPTIKYYLREGLLMPGRATSATGATYGQEHVRRIRIVKALTDVAGLPIQRIKTVLELIDNPGQDLFDTLGRALAALPPYPADNDNAPADYPLARAALQLLGQAYHPDSVAVAQLERALHAVADAGLPMTEERLRTYADCLMTMAKLDVGRMPQNPPSAAVEYAVLGTALYEPVILAMRRLAHEDLAERLLTNQTDNTDNQP